MTAVAARGGDSYHGNGSWPIPGLLFTGPDGVTFWAFKAGEGIGYTDPEFAASWARARKLLDWQVAYWYARPEQSTAAAQMARALAVIKAAGGFKQGDGFLLDLEASTLTQAQTAAWQHAAVDYLITHSPLTVNDIYMGGYSRNGSGAGAKAAGWRGLWFPRYAKMSAIDHYPTTFAPSDPGNTTGLTIIVHQFTSNYLGRSDADISPYTAKQLADPNLLSPNSLELTVAQYDDIMAALAKLSGHAEGSIAHDVASYTDTSISTHTLYGSAAGVRNALDPQPTPPAGVTGTLSLPALAAAVVDALPASAGGAAPTADEVADAVIAKLGATLTTTPAGVA